MMRKAAAINKGQRSSNQRGRRPPPSDPTAGHSPLSPPPAPPPDARKNLRPRRGRVPFFDGYDSSSSSEEEDERGRRKVKLVLKLPHSPHSPATAPRPCKPAALDAHTPLSASSSSASDSSNTEDDAVKPLKKRRISGCDDGVRSDGSGHDEGLLRNSLRELSYRRGKHWSPLSTSFRRKTLIVCLRSLLTQKSFLTTMR